MENEFYLDPHSLDEEWLKQPEFAAKYAKLQADATRSLDLAKNELKLVEATLAEGMRLNPADYNIKKVSEAAISSSIPKQAIYQDANKAVIDAKHELAVLQAAMMAIEHRKKALENLVTLHMADYYSSPREPKTRTDTMSSNKLTRQRSVRERNG